MEPDGSDTGCEDVPEGWFSSGQPGLHRTSFSINHRFFAEQDPFLVKLREDPRFEALMELARAKQREIEAEV